MSGEDQSPAEPPSPSSLPPDPPVFDSAQALLSVEEQGYAKSLSHRHVRMIAVGGAIGTGLFLGAGGRLHTAGPSLAIVYALCGVVVFLVMRVPPHAPPLRRGGGRCPREQKANSDRSRACGTSRRIRCRP